MCRDNFENDSERNSDIATTMKDIFSNIGQRILTKKAIMEKEHILIKLGLVEIVDDDEITLTDEGKEYFYAEDILAFCKPMKCDDIYAFIEKVYVYFHSDNYNSSNGDCMNKLIKTISKLENANKHIPEVKRIYNLIPNECERVLFYTVGQSMIENDPISLSFEIQKLYPVRKRKQVLNDFMNNKHSLQKTDLVEIEKTSSLFGESTIIVLTDKGKEVLLGEDAPLYIDNVSDKQLLACDNIIEKKVVFLWRTEGATIAPQQQPK